TNYMLPIEVFFLNQLSWVKTEGKSVYIDCRVIDLTTDYIHWYQQKDGEAMTRILYIKHDDFSVTLEKGDAGDNYVLKVGSMKLNHAGVYYCAVWTGSHSEINCSHPVQ
uniref:T cell receptor gamma variable 5 n=1 Tax=Astyanax mexicanus TaxID=7994 RepID=A0A8B9GQV9_ASTMX